MRGYLKASGVIEQCSRCYALRDIFTTPDECPSCRQLLNVKHNETQSLVLCDVSSDAATDNRAVLQLAMEAHA